MSYLKSLEAAGAKVHHFQEFGSYQGDWLACVTYKGQKGFVQGAYGSCSGCDAFQGEFDYSYDKESKDHDQRLALFGESYLLTILNSEEILQQHKDNDWDMELDELRKWVTTIQNLEFHDKLEKVINE